MWCDTVQCWIPDNLITDSFAEWEIEQDDILFAGVDLAATGDLVALAILTQRGDKFFAKVNYYVPSESLTRGVNADLYRRWARERLIIVTDGNVTDYDRVTQDLLKITSNNVIKNVAYDSWNATQWAITATAEGLPLKPYSQSIGNFNKPTKELARLLNSGKMVIEPSEVTRFCFANVALKVDQNGNEKPSKESKSKKIDGVIAICQALGGAMDSPLQSYSIFSF